MKEIKAYEKIMEDKDVEAAFEYMLPRVSTVQMYNLLLMLKDEFETYEIAKLIAGRKDDNA